MNKVHLIYQKLNKMYEIAEQIKIFEVKYISEIKQKIQTYNYFRKSNKKGCCKKK